MLSSLRIGTETIIPKIPIHDALKENISDDIKNSKRFLDFETKDLSKFLYEINREGQ